MLSEPLSITYNSVSKSLPRTSFGGPNGEPAMFRSSTGEFQLFITETRVKDLVRTEVILERAEVDTDLANGHQYYPVRFGVVYEFDSSLYNVATDIPLLRTALLAFVDSTLQGRIIGGEK